MSEVIEWEDHEKIFERSKERMKLALKDASLYLQQLVDEKGFFTQKDVDEAMSTFVEIRTDTVEKAVRSAFHLVQGEVAFLSANDSDYIIAETVRNKRPFIWYELEIFGNSLSIWWKLSNSNKTGRKYIVDPDYRSICDAGKDILKEVTDERPETD